MKNKLDEKSYLELNLPIFLQESIDRSKPILEMLEKGVESKYLPSCWDCILDELNSDINYAEVEDLITSEQAWYLREKYFGREKC